MDSNISIFAPKTDRIKRCNYKTNGGLMLINDLAKDWNGPLDKIDSQIILYTNIKVYHISKLITSIWK
jgi:hypothetical protein